MSRVPELYICVVMDTEITVRVSTECEIVLDKTGARTEKYKIMPGDVFTLNVRKNTES